MDLNVSRWHYTVRVPTALLALKVKKELHDFRLLPRSRRELRSSGLLRSVWWQIRRFWITHRSYFKGFLTDVSGQPIGPVLRVFLPTFRGSLSVLF